MATFELKDVKGLKSQTTIIGMSNLYAKQAAEQWGGTAAQYKGGAQGTLATVQREGTAALQYVQILRRDIQDYMDSYTWKNEPDSDYGHGWYIVGTENADKLGIRYDAQGLQDVIAHKLAEGEGRAMAIRIKIALEAMPHGGAADVTDYIEWVMYASYEEGMREGVSRTKKQRSLYQSIIEVIRNA